MVGVKRVIAVGGLAAVLFGLVGCPSPLLTRIKEEIAKAPFTGTSYKFVAQFGSPHPEYAFANPMRTAAIPPIATILFTPTISLSPLHR